MHLVGCFYGLTFYVDDFSTSLNNAHKRVLRDTRTGRPSRVRELGGIFVYIFRMCDQMHVCKYGLMCLTCDCIQACVLVCCQAILPQNPPNNIAGETRTIRIQYSTRYSKRHSNTNTPLHVPTHMHIKLINFIYIIYIMYTHVCMHRCTIKHIKNAI